MERIRSFNWPLLKCEDFGRERGVVGVGREVICMVTDELYLFVLGVLACVVVCDRRKEMKAKII